MGKVCVNKEHSGRLDGEKRSFLLMDVGFVFTKIYRRSFMDEHHIRFAEHVMAEDMDYLAIVIAKARYANCVEEILVEHRSTKDSATKSGSSASGYEDILNCVIRAYQGMRACPEYKTFMEGAETFYLGEVLLCLEILDAYREEQVISAEEYQGMINLLRNLCHKIITHPVRENAWVKRYMKPENRDRMIAFMEKKEGVLLK